MHETKLKSIALFDAFLFILLKLKLKLRKGFNLFNNIKKDIYIVSNLFLF